MQKNPSSFEVNDDGSFAHLFVMLGNDDDAQTNYTLHNVVHNMCVCGWRGVGGGRQGQVVVVLLLYCARANLANRDRTRGAH